MSQSIALITGASSGLGQEYVRQLSRDPKVQEIWAIARRKDRPCPPSPPAPSGPSPWT